MRIAPFAGRLTAACRRACLLSLSLIPMALVASAQPAALSGTVVDPDARAVPRARVLLLTDTATREVKTDESGRFTFPATPEGNCWLEARLTGFKAMPIPCSTPPPIQLELTVAPIAETVVVTPTRTATPAGQAGVSITTFTAEDLERRRNPLVSDLLRTSAGVMVVQSGGVGSATSLFVRGGESNYNKVLLDGIPLNEPGGTFDFSNITTVGLERVEVVRGAQSALFGSDAMASVVQLFTKHADRSDQRLHVSGGLEAGGFSTVNANAVVAQNTDAGDYSVSIARLRTDNEGENAGFENTTLTANLGRSFGERTSLRFVGRGELGLRGTPGQTAFGRPDLDASSDRHELVGGATFDQQTTPTVRQRASYSLSYSRQISQNLLTDPPYTPEFEDHVGAFVFEDYLYDLTTDLRRHHVSYQADLRLPLGAQAVHLMTLLADWDGERATLDDGLAPTEASRDNFGMSVQHQALWPRVFVTVSGRFEHNDSFGNAFVPRGSVAFVVHQDAGSFGETKVHLRGGLGIKEPTILQSFSPPPYAGNPDLEPERSRGVEFGIDQRLAGDHMRIEATWFDNRFRNIISTRTVSFDPFLAQYFNVGLTSARGAEVNVEVATTDALRLRTGYTWLDSEVLESTAPFNEVFREGAELFRRPRHSGFVGLSFTHNRFAADVTGVLVGQYVDSDFSALEPPMVENPGQKVWDLRASYEFMPQLTVVGSIDNFTNHEYMEPLGYPGLSRVARIGIRTRF